MTLAAIFVFGIMFGFVLSYIVVGDHYINKQALLYVADELESLEDECNEQEIRFGIQFSYQMIREVLNKEFGDK